MKNKLLKNLGWKLGGLLVALALWFHLTTEQQFHKQLTIDIEYINIPAGLMLSPNCDKSVIVELSADGKHLFKILYFENVNLVIDLNDFTSEGQYSIPFHEDQLLMESDKNDIEIEFIAPLACDFGLVPRIQASQ